MPTPLSTGPSEQLIKSKSLLKQIIEDRILLHQGPKAEIKAPGGKSSLWIFDFRAVALNSQFLDIFSEIFFENFGDLYPFQVGGMETAAIPLITSLVLKGKQISKPISGVYIRKSKKKYDLMKQIEGELTNEPMILIDDLINSGRSLLRQVEILEQHQITVAAVFVIVQFRPLISYSYFETKKIPVRAIFNLSDFGLQLGEDKDLTVSTFRSVWKIQSEGADLSYVASKSTPTIHDGLVYLPKDNGVIEARAKDTGALRWRFTCGLFPKGKHVNPTPHIYKEILYFSTTTGTLYALHTKTGDKLWSLSEADRITSSVISIPSHNLVCLGVTYSKPYFKGAIEAFDPTSGKKNWMYQTSAAVGSTPLYVREIDAVIAGDFEGVVHCVSAKNGFLRWSYTTSSSIKGAPVLSPSNEEVFIPTLDGNVYALSVRTGQLTHRFLVGEPVVSTPLVLGNRLVISCLDKNIYCFDTETEKEIWRFSTKGRVFSTPTEFNGKIYVGSNDGSLYELDSISGKETGFFQTTERITGQVVPDPSTGLLYIPTFTNGLYCLEPADETPPFV